MNELKELVAHHIKFKLGRSLNGYAIMGFFFINLMFKVLFEQGLKDLEHYALVHREVTISFNC